MCQHIYKSNPLHFIFILVSTLAYGEHCVLFPSWGLSHVYICSADYEYGNCLPQTLLSGVVWHNSPGIFNKWKQVFLILTRDTVKWHHIQKTSSINHHQVSGASEQISDILQDTLIDRSDHRVHQLDPHLWREFRGEARLPHSLHWRRGCRQELLQENFLHQVRDILTSSRDGPDTTRLQAVGRSHQGDRLEEEGRVRLHQFVQSGLAVLWEDAEEEQEHRQPPGRQQRGRWPRLQALPHTGGRGGGGQTGALQHRVPTENGFI